MSFFDNDCIAVAADWFLSKKEISDYSKEDQKLLKFVKSCLQKHVVGGLIAEEIIRYAFNINSFGGIWSWDGIINGTLIEIKAETSTPSKTKLNLKGSYAKKTKDTPCKRELYLNVRPTLINVGICQFTSKCMYVFATDTNQLPKDSKFFAKLTADKPQTSLTDIKMSPLAIKNVYKNLDLVVMNKAFMSKLLFDRVSVEAFNDVPAKRMSKFKL